MSYRQISVPPDGAAIARRADGTLDVPDRPIIPVIEGDGIGVDVTPVMRAVVDAAVAKAYGGRRSIAWLDAYAGAAAVRRYGEGQHLPEETLRALDEFVVSIKGPLETPVGGGLRSINVEIRQRLDLYACIRPVRYFEGASSPSKLASDVDMVVFRENTEDIYTGIEWAAGSPEARKLLDFLERELGVTELKFRDNVGLGVKPVSREGSRRLIRKALEYAVRYDRRSVTLVHKGNIMKFTEGAFRNWGYELAKEEFGARELGAGPWLSFASPRTGREIVVKDVIADNFLQQIALAPGDYDVIATLNLNGDYISDALAAQVGGIGIAPGANVGDGHAVFEATHGTAPSLAGQDRVNPSSLILSAEMMLRHIGWDEAAALIVRGVAATIAARELTFDLAVSRDAKGSARGGLEPGVTLVGTRGFGAAVIRRMDG